MEQIEKENTFDLEETPKRRTNNEILRTLKAILYLLGKDGESLSKAYEYADENMPLRAKPKPRFEPPTKAEVAEYMKEIGFTEGDPDYFCNYYSARGWKIKGEPISKWRSCVRTWQRRSKEWQNVEEPNKFDEREAKKEKEYQ